MLNWDEVQKTIKGFMKSEVLGNGYVDEYYNSFAYTLTQYLKELEQVNAPAAPTRVNWGVTWFVKTPDTSGTSRLCDRCGQQRQLYRGSNQWGNKLGAFCTQCQPSVLRGEA